MSKVSLKITIAGRTYPLNVPESDEEKVTKAAADINKAVEMLRKNYAVNDHQDLIAMSALQLLAKVSNESAWEVGLACGGEIAIFLEQIN
mgnify:CR=1 FL=1